MSQRELKFRAWDKLNKKMLTSFMVSSDGTAFAVRNLEQYEPDVFRAEIPMMSDVVLMQFTGLKDRHGKEIYEGDILSMKSDKHAPGGGYIAGTYRHHPENAKVVEYRNAAFYLDRHLLHSEVVFQERYGGLEILGNIYEHPELLTPEAR